MHYCELYTLSAVTYHIFGSSDCDDIYMSYGSQGRHIHDERPFTDAEQ